MRCTRRSIPPIQRPRPSPAATPWSSAGAWPGCWRPGSWPTTSSGVTLLERDRFTETPAARKGLPQGRHVHVLLERGRGAMERFLPGLTGELVRAGAKPLDATRDVAWMNPYGWYVRFPGDLLLLASTRDLIDWGVRGRVAALPERAASDQEADVAGLIRGPGDGARVAGVRLRSRTADAEVDRGGQNSPPIWWWWPTAATPASPNG